MDILRFENNIPLELSFLYSKGKPTDGPDFFRQTTDKRGVYIPSSVEDHVNALKLRKGEPVAIVKRKLKSGETRWEVERAGQPKTCATPTGQAITGNGGQSQDTPLDTTPVVTSQATSPQKAARATPQRAANSVPREMRKAKEQGAAELLNRSSSIDNPYADDPPRKPPSRLESALKTAVSAAAAAEKHGLEIGYNVRFTPADIRAMGISVLISMEGRSAA